MATIDIACRIDAEPYQHIAAKGFDERHAAARGCASDLGQYFSFGQAIKHLLYQRQALLNFLDADPNAGIDVAVLPYGHIELKLVVGGITDRLAGVEIAP